MAEWLKPRAAPFLFCLLAAPHCSASVGGNVVTDSSSRSEQPPLGFTKPAPSYHEQSQDHFDSENHRTWRQAYYVNDTFWTPGSDSPVFLCVGGEGPPLDGSAVVSSVHCNIAVEWLKQKKALMFALEHRYYGCHNMSACPVTDLTRPGALMYLSSRQAIEDIASFVSDMNTKYKLGRNRWVTWGGSYPGMLAGWSRLKHPELIHASVASSAPVSATFDMSEYMDHMAVAYTVEDNGVGGSAACRDAIRAGHAWIEDRFKAGEAAKVETRFGLAKDSLDSLDKRIDFAASGVANFPAQENDPLCDTPACNIAKVCAIMKNSSLGDEVQRLIHLREVQGVGHPEAMLRSSAPWQSSMRTGLRGVSAPVSDLQMPDFWFYQTCKEFGFYQTCEVNSKCMFVRGILNVSYFAKGCRSQFNYSFEEVQININATNAHYGGRHPTGPRDGSIGRCVMWPNGEVDPWSTRSVLESPSRWQPTLYVPGASHHSWTWPSRSGDQDSVMSARVQIREQVDYFLRHDCSEDGSGAGKLPGLNSTVIIVGLSALVVVVLCLVALARRIQQGRARQALLAGRQEPGVRSLSMQQPQP